MICVLSVLIMLFGLTCIKKGPFLFGWNNFHCHRIVAADKIEFPFPLHSYTNHTRRLWLCFQEGKESPFVCISTDAHSNGNCLTRARAPLCSARGLK